ncbi:MAG: helix-turn-helix domain-containing protein [Desulfobacterales bacterium]
MYQYLYIRFGPFQKRAIQTALQRNRGRKVATARELGIDKNTLRRKILRLGIEKPV